MMTRVILLLGVLLGPARAYPFSFKDINSSVMFNADDGSPENLVAPLEVIDDNATYWDLRQKLFLADRETSLGSDLQLIEDEERLNTILKAKLKSEITDSFNTLAFPPSENFLKSKKKMEESSVFQFIKGMPKGAILHIHDTAMTSIDFVVSNITYMDDLFICDTQDFISFRFSSALPTLPCDSQWQSVEVVRGDYSSVEEYDAYLWGRISLATDDPDSAYPNINAMWAKFGAYFAAVSGLLGHRPAFERYLTQAMQEAMDDGVSYFEFRGTLDPLYEVDGSSMSQLETARCYKETVDKFVAANDDFAGVKFIYGPQRLVPIATVWKYMETVKTLVKELPDFVAGFDLVGQEDAGFPLKDFVEPLLTLSSGEPKVPVFYHAAETNWYGLDTDENMYDALALNTTRVGHGYALNKHPTLLKELRERDVPIEVNPISNQVLLLTADLRNHPAAGWAAAGQPLVVSSDDPAVWAALPLSHDFYEALMVMGGARADLRFLKQLGLNSVRYSSLSGDRKDALGLLFNRQWDAWVQTSLAEMQTSSAEQTPRYLESNEVYAED